MRTRARLCVCVIIPELTYITDVAARLYATCSVTFGGSRSLLEASCVSSDIE